MAAVCLACRLDTWPLERHRIALITDRDEWPLPKAWIWLCQPCLRRFRTGEPLGAADLTMPTHQPSSATTDGVASITAREREIATLIAQGLSNRDIAGRLVLMSGTVANHVAHIMRKLGFRTRAEVAVWAVRNGLVPDAHNGHSAALSRLRPAVRAPHGTNGRQDGTAAREPTAPLDGAGAVSP